MYIWWIEYKNAVKNDKIITKYNVFDILYTTMWWSCGWLGQKFSFFTVFYVLALSSYLVKVQC